MIVDGPSTIVKISPSIQLTALSGRWSDFFGYKGDSRRGDYLIAYAPPR
jgi:hypothetical protein